MSILEIVWWRKIILKKWVFWTCRAVFSTMNMI